MTHRAPRRRARLAPAIIAVLLGLGFSLPALAVDTGGGGDAPAAAAAPTSRMAPKTAVAAPKAAARHIDLNEARQLIAKSDWDGAIKLLRVIVVQQPRNADALNLLGFSLRNRGEMKQAVAYYLKALKIAPNHLGANEYLGELYAMTGEMAKAKAQLAKLEKLCGNASCAEYKDLAEAIAKA